MGLGTTGNDLVGIYGLLVFGLPIFAGVVVDRFGFKRSLLACFSIFCVGYTLIGLAGLPAGQPFVATRSGKKGYVVLALVVTAIGGSLIKPCVVGTVARTTTEETKSLGYSIYYTLVNFGGRLGPILASRGAEAFGHRRTCSSCRPRVSGALVLGTLLFYREPPRARASRRARSRRSSRTRRLVFWNVRFILFLVIFSGFWIMFWQVFYALPFYVTDVLKIARVRAHRDRGRARHHRPFRPRDGAHEEAPPDPRDGARLRCRERLLARDALGQSWQGAVAAMLLFALGESMQAPRFYEYVADLAPKEQAGTYMGFAFLPVAIGAFVGGPACRAISSSTT